MCVMVIPYLFSSVWILFSRRGVRTGVTDGYDGRTPSRPGRWLRRGR